MSTKDWSRFLLLGLLWGTSFLWIKIALAEVSPLVLVGFRTLSGALGLLVVIALTRLQLLRWREIKPWLGPFILVGLFNVAIPFLLISWAEQYIDSAIASILNATVPLFSILLAPLLVHDDRWSVPKLLGLLVGFVGVIVLFSPELLGKSSQSLVGQAAMLGATCSYALGAILARRGGRGLDPRSQSFLQLGSATVMVWALTLIIERPIRLPHLPITWFALLWLGLLGSCLAYILYFSLIHSIGPTRTTTVTYLLPLIGVILGATFLGERLHWTDLAGGMLILSGVIVVNTPGLIARWLKGGITLKPESPAPIDKNADE